MELVEYMPGALAAGWMVFKFAVLLRNGRQAPAQEQAAWD